MERRKREGERKMIEVRVGSRSVLQHPVATAASPFPLSLPLETVCCILHSESMYDQSISYETRMVCCDRQTDTLIEVCTAREGANYGGGGYIKASPATVISLRIYQNIPIPQDQLLPLAFLLPPHHPEP